MTISEPQKVPGKKHRDCPALGRVITSAACGSQRGTKLDCPATCPHFPFGVAGHELWWRVGQEWSRKAIEMLIPRLGRDALPTLLKQHAVPVTNEELLVEVAIQQMMMAKLFVERDAAGQALSDGWEDRPLSGLNNDERLMTRCRRQARVTVVEVQRVLDGQSFLGRDLFDPERPPFLVVDAATAPRVVRFARLLTWLTHYPKVSRLGLPAFEVPHPVYREWLTRVQNEFAQASAGTPGLALKDYLSLHLGRCASLIQAVVAEQAEKLRARTDMNRCLAAYALRAPATEVEARLTAMPEFRRQEPSEADPPAEPHTRFVWLRQGESAALDRDLEGLFHLDTSFEGARTVGTVRVYAGRLLVETLARTKHAFARRMIEQHLGDLVTFEQEAIEDLTQLAASRDRGEATVGAAQQVFFPAGEEARASAPAPATPADETAAADAARKEGLRQEHERHYREFLDQPLDLLEGKSPRAAAAEPALRAPLTELLKSHLHGIAVRNREEGLDLEINAILETLGLDELR